MPRVSVIMPLYKAEKFVESAMVSILNQQYKDFEVIAIDDCGNDGTSRIVETINDKRIKVIHNDRNRGIAYSRNIGIENAAGEFIALMDDDDIAMPERLALEVEFMDMHPDIDVVGAAMKNIDFHGNVTSFNVTGVLHNPKRVRAELIFRDCISNGSAMMRTQFIRKNNIKYVDDMLGMEDYHFWVQCSLHGQISNIPNVLLYWRNTGTNETFHVKDNKTEQRKLMYKEIQKFALKSNGFVLTQEEQEMFFKHFREDKKYASDAKELKQLYALVSSLIQQGNSMDFATEWKAACKKMFAECVKVSRIFD